MSIGEFVEHIQQNDPILLNPTESIFLVGPMGAGKTTIGRLLARELKREFFDSDHEIEKRTGADIPWIFDIEGEEGFRDREEKVIDDLTRKSGVVISTGGGVVLSEQNRKYLFSRGVVLYLQVSVDQQMTRTEKDVRRPALRTPDRKTVLKEMSDERTRLYEDIADYIISTNDQSPRSVLYRILKILRAKERARS